MANLRGIPTSALVDELARRGISPAKPHKWREDTEEWNLDFCEGIEKTESRPEPIDSLAKFMQGRGWKTLREWMDDGCTHRELPDAVQEIEWRERFRTRKKDHKRFCDKCKARKKERKH